MAKNTATARMLRRCASSSRSRSTSAPPPRRSSAACSRAVSRSWPTRRISERPADRRRTFGYERAELVVVEGIGELAALDWLKRDVKRMLRKECGVGHATLEIEDRTCTDERGEATATSQKEPSFDVLETTT